MAHTWQRGRPIAQAIIALGEAPGAMRLLGIGIGSIMRLGPELILIAHARSVCVGAGNGKSDRKQCPLK